MIRQLIESTDITNFAQLLAYIQFEAEDKINENILFCEPLNIRWKKCIGVCTDGAKGSTDKHSGVLCQIKAVDPETKFTHCSIHHEALVTKEIPEKLKTVLDQSI